MLVLLWNTSLSFFLLGYLIHCNKHFCEFQFCYGIVVAALKMLSTVAAGLAIDVWGPISDDAGGFAE